MKQCFHLMSIQKKTFMLIKMSSGNMSVTISTKTDSNLAQIVLKETDCKISDFYNLHNNTSIFIDKPIKIEGVIFIAKVPPLLKCKENIILSTVEGFYNQYINHTTLEGYVYTRIRAVMRYRLFSRDNNNRHLFAIPKRKNIRLQLLEFYNKLSFDNDDYGEPIKLTRNQADDEFLKYLDFEESAIERFSVKFSTQ